MHQIVNVPNTYWNSEYETAISISVELIPLHRFVRVCSFIPPTRIIVMIVRILSRVSIPHCIKQSSDNTPIHIYNSRKNQKQNKTENPTVENPPKILDSKHHKKCKNIMITQDSTNSIKTSMMISRQLPRDSIKYRLHRPSVSHSYGPIHSASETIGGLRRIWSSEVSCSLFPI